MGRWSGIERFDLARWAHTEEDGLLMGLGRWLGYGLQQKESEQSSKFSHQSEHVESSSIRESSMTFDKTEEDLGFVTGMESMSSNVK